MKIIFALIALAIVSTSHVAVSDTTTRPACAGDERYPDIDYSHTVVRQACERGGFVSGWWVIENRLDTFDETTTTVALNFSQITSTDTTSTAQSLGIGCAEGDLLIAIFNLPMHTGFSSDDFLRVGYRLDGADPQYVEWRNNNNRTVSRVDENAEAFMLEIYRAQKIQIRVFGDSRIDSKSDLSGIQGAVKAVADACNWETGQAADPIAAQAAKDDALARLNRTIQAKYEDANVLKSIVREIAECWKPAVGRAGDTTVSISVGAIRSSGHVESAGVFDEERKRRLENDPQYREAVKAAVEAVNRCSPLSFPYEGAPPYFNFEMEFDPDYLSALISPKGNSNPTATYKYGKPGVNN